jgi:hypothetical protein
VRDTGLVGKAGSLAGASLDHHVETRLGQLSHGGGYERDRRSPCRVSAGTPTMSVARSSAPVGIAGQPLTTTGRRSRSEMTPTRRPSSSTGR